MTSQTLPAELRDIATGLRRAEIARSAVDQPSTARPGLTVDEAYAIQRANIDERLAAGERRVGRKIGLTSEAIQRQLGVDSPDFGVILDSMVVADAGTLDLGELIAARAEAEFAFRFGADVPVAPTRDQLVAALDGVAVAIEVIDSRVRDWRITLPDTVADNASSARMITGAFVPATDALLAAVPALEIEMLRDGAVLTVGPGSAVLGDPITSLLWLASAIGAYGESFAAGDIVLAGAVSAAVDLDAPATWTARAAGLPPVSFTTETGGE